MKWTGMAATLIIIAASAEARAQSLEGPVWDLRTGEPITRTSITLLWTSVYEWALGNTSYLGRYSESDPATISIDAWWSASMGLWDLPTADYIGEDKVYEVTGLLPGRTYYFVVKAVDSAGIPGLDYSGVASATTDPDTVPPGAPSSPSGSGSGEGSLRFTWISSGDDGSAGSATSYEIRISSSPDTADPGDWWSRADPVADPPTPAESGTPQRLDFRGLAPSQTYTVGIRACDPGGNFSPISFAIGVATGAVEPRGEKESSGCAGSAGTASGLSAFAALLVISARTRRPRCR